MAIEADAVHVEGLSLHPVGGRPYARHRRQLGIIVGRRDVELETLPAFVVKELDDHLEARRSTETEPVEPAEVDEVPPFAGERAGAFAPVTRSYGTLHVYPATLFAE
jgi:hypothetical protein